MDSLSISERSERMSRVRGKNTGPELTVRRLIHGLGYRFRLHPRDLPGTPDLVFPGRRKGDLRARLLLASASRSGLLSGADAQIAAGLLDGELRND